MNNMTFQQKLNESLSKYKGNLAVEYGSETLTYEELDERSNYIANWLFDKFCKKEAFIGVLMDNRMELISTAVGLLKAGCVFIPLDSSYPDGRLAEMIGSTGIECIVCDYVNFNRAEAINGSGGGGKRVEFIHIDDMFLEGKPQWFDTGPDIAYDPEDKIYIYFTSGTTGSARAIIGKNKGLRHFIDWEIETFNINGSFRTSQFIIPVFDVFLRDVFVPLCVGGTVCIPESKDMILNSDDLIAWIDKNRIHLINCVPSLFRLMLPPAAGGNNFKDLCFVLLAGEKINPSELADWYDIFDERIQLVNLYGPTETTLAKIHYPIRKPDIRRERIPIGKPMKGARAIILDKNMEICDTLVKGEIHIRTPFRTFGYYNDPGLNREKFIPNPFNNDPDDILYKTGDLGRLLPDGNIDILGRIDGEVTRHENRVGGDREPIVAASVCTGSRGSKERNSR
jgi:amino acid adenylation domain-containing protein